MYLSMNESNGMVVVVKRSLLGVVASGRERCNSSPLFHDWMGTRFTCLFMEGSALYKNRLETNDKIHNFQERLQTIHSHLKICHTYTAIFDCTTRFHSLFV